MSRLKSIMEFFTLVEFEEIEKRIIEYAKEGLKIDIGDALKLLYFTMNNDKNRHDKHCKCNDFQTEKCKYYLPKIVLKIPEAPPVPSLSSLSSSP
jgi:hypothetical protein